MPSIVSKDIYDSRVLRSKSDANPYTLFQGKLSPTNILKNKYLVGVESREPVKSPFSPNESFLSVDIRYNSIFHKESNIMGPQKIRSWVLNLILPRKLSMEM